MFVAFCFRVDHVALQTNTEKRVQANDANAVWGGAVPLAGSLLCGCGVNYTPKWAGTSGLHRTE